MTHVHVESSAERGDQTMRSFAIAGGVVAALLILSTPRVLAQAVANAQMHGVISDPSGALIAGAQIKARQTDTGQVLSTVSNGDGSYVLPNLPVGPYRLDVSTPAFNAYLQSGL